MSGYVFSAGPFLFRVEWDGRYLRRIDFLQKRLEFSETLPSTLELLKNEFSLYFEGKLKYFSRYPLFFDSLTPFTRRVLEVVSGIPYGSVMSYGDVAEKLGGRRLARSVGLSLSRNPFPIIVPCHRVVRSDGSIGGFSQGVHIKRFLLSLEGIV